MKKVIFFKILFLLVMHSFNFASADEKFDEGIPCPPKQYFNEKENSYYGHIFPKNTKFDCTGEDGVAITGAIFPKGFFYGHNFLGPAQIEFRTLSNRIKIFTAEDPDYYSKKKKNKSLGYFIKYKNFEFQNKVYVYENTTKDLFRVKSGKLRSPQSIEGVTFDYVILNLDGSIFAIHSTSDLTIDGKTCSSEDNFVRLLNDKPYECLCKKYGNGDCILKHDLTIDDFQLHAGDFIKLKENGSILEFKLNSPSLKRISDIEIYKKINPFYEDLSITWPINSKLSSYEDSLDSTIETSEPVQIRSFKFIGNNRFHLTDGILGFVITNENQELGGLKIKKGKIYFRNNANYFTAFVLSPPPTENSGPLDCVSDGPAYFANGKLAFCCNPKHEKAKDICIEKRKQFRECPEQSEFKACGLVKPSF